MNALYGGSATNQQQFPVPGNIGDPTPSPPVTTPQSPRHAADHLPAGLHAQVQPGQRGPDLRRDRVGGQDGPVKAVEAVEEGQVLVEFESDHG